MQHPGWDTWQPLQHMETDIAWKVEEITWMDDEGLYKMDKVINKITLPGHIRWKNWQAENKSSFCIMFIIIFFKCKLILYQITKFFVTA